MKKLLVVLVLLLAAVPAVRAQDAEREAVKAAVLDYVEALYQVDTARVVRSVHPQLAKRGFSLRGSAYGESTMSYAQLMALTKTWNKAGRVDPDKAPKEVIVYDVQDQTAIAKLNASWGQDYLMLAKYNGKWKITQVLWQSYPPAKTSQRN